MNICKHFCNYKIKKMLLHGSGQIMIVTQGMAGNVWLQMPGVDLCGQCSRKLPSHDFDINKWASKMKLNKCAKFFSVSDSKN